MKLSIVTAMTQGGVIGNENRLPWKQREDMRHFQVVTEGHHVIAGRLTQESIGRALPGRTNIVLSRQLVSFPGCIVVSSLSLALQYARAHGETEAMIIGGRQVYELALPFVNTIYRTLILDRGEIKGDTLFPKTDWCSWALVKKRVYIPMHGDKKNQYAMQFLQYDRK